MSDILIVGIYWGTVGFIVGVLLGRFIGAVGVADPYDDDDEGWK